MFIHCYFHLPNFSFSTMGSLNISHVEIKGVKEVFEKHKDEVSKGIKVHFNMDDSGILNVDKVRSLFCSYFSYKYIKFIYLIYRLTLYSKKLKLLRKRNQLLPVNLYFFNIFSNLAFFKILFKKSEIKFQVFLVEVPQKMKR